MKKSLLYLMLLLIVWTVNVSHADAVPDITGNYSGTCTNVVSSCSNPGDDGTYEATLSISISTQSGSTFSGTAINNYSGIATESIQLSGTITESGQISGTSTHTFSDGGGGEGTFTGQLNGDTLTIENPGHDTSGDTCDYIRYMSATREGNIPSVNFPESLILPSDGTAQDYFGCSVSISGNYAIVGARSDDDNGDSSGSAYIFERSGSNWNQIAKLTASEGLAGDYFGCSVSISGNYTIVGAWGDDINGDHSGSAYIFERNGSSWNQVAKLTASDGDTYDAFGDSVSISGDYAIVGADLDDVDVENQGSAYIFERIDSSWNQIAKLTTSDGVDANGRFGGSVSISGDYAIVGAHGNQGNEDYSGSAYIFERSDSSWNQVAKLTASDGAKGDMFGISVSILGTYAIVGAKGDADNGTLAGSAYIFERGASSWDQMAKLTASDGAQYDYFGNNVSISDDYAIVSALGDDGPNGNSSPSGSVYIYERDDSSWNLVAKLASSYEDSSGDGIVSISGTSYGGAGGSVSVSGGYAIVGGATYINSRFLTEAAFIYDLFPPYNLVDAILSLQVIAAENPLDISSLQDVNSDGLIGLEEAIFILQSVAGLR